MKPQLSGQEIKSEYKFLKGHSFFYGLFHFSMLRLLFIAICLGTVSCSQTELKEPVEYTGPLREAENVERYNSEDEQIKSKLTAELIYEFANGDLEFPNGLHIEMYDEFGRLEVTLRANYAKYIKEEDRWRGQGKVELKNVVKNEQLNTEELFWNQKTKKIYTDKFVTIRQQGDVIYGTGLDAKQDLTDYVITNPEGTIEVNE